MKIRFYLCSLIIGFSLMTEARGGGDSVGNGGDRVAGEFVSTARDAIRTLSLMRLPTYLQGMMHTLATNVDLVQVNSKQDLNLSGNPVDGINYPDQKHILVSRARWLQNPNIQSMDTKRFVLHEYLGVSGFDDSTYDMSSTLVRFLQVSDLGRFQFVYQALVNFDEAAKAMIRDYDSLSNSSGPAQAKIQTCTGISNYQSLSDAAAQGLTMNKADLENDGIQNLEGLLQQLAQCRSQLATLCADPNSNPVSLVSFLNQIQNTAANVLTSFNAPAIQPMPASP